MGSIFNKYNSFIKLLPLIILIMMQVSCKKYLEQKRSSLQATPTSVADFLALVDNMFGNSFTCAHQMEFVADNYYLKDVTALTDGSPADRMSYVWDKDAIPYYLSNWGYPYEAIYNANFILDYLPTVAIKENEKDQADHVKGDALFIRSMKFFSVAQLFCQPYSPSTASDLGIVVRLTSAVTAPSSRATVQETYDQMIADAKAAADLLPVKAEFSTHATKAAAYGLLARIYLSMRDYTNAEIYADRSLSENSALLDYNALAPANDPTLPDFTENPEILFNCSGNNILFQPEYCNIDTLLYQSYDDNDLRKTTFFGLKGNDHYWKGGYHQDNVPWIIFDGIATDEMYLIRAECRARNENVSGAMSDLNTLLRKRWKTGMYTDLTAANSTEALNQILTERRKELLFRGLRWTDLRRFNLDGANITLKRIVNGVTYTLPPNDLRWVLLIPVTEETSLSGIQQNPR